MEENENTSNTASSEDAGISGMRIKSEYSLDLIDYSLIQSFPAQLDDLCSSDHVLSNVEIEECLDSYQDGSEITARASGVEVSSMDSISSPCGTDGIIKLEVDVGATDVLNATSIQDTGNESSSQNVSEPSHDDLKAQESGTGTSSSNDDDASAMCHGNSGQQCTIDCFIANKEFFFESDHPILKNNSDYRKLLYVVLELEAKRAKAIKDLEVLRELKNKALADPITFVKKLQRGEDVGIPKRQEIPEMPDIDWSQYSISVAESGLKKRQYTRHNIKGGSDLINLFTKPVGSGRGRKPRQEAQKPLKLSQPWSVEEQKKLEELLIKYPDEDRQVRRWEKIANELENRTPTQVASRVQKYFIKLLKAGMPIPGRQPNSSYLRKPRRHIVRQQPSTFFPSYVLPVQIDDKDITMSSLMCSQPQSDDEDMLDVEVSDDDDIPPEQRNTPEYQKLICIKKAMRRKKERYIVKTAQHIGYKCTRCSCDPIIGVRWHCTECPSSVSTDFCGDCVESLHETDCHSAIHKMEAIRHVSSVTGFDSDYSFINEGEYNYLDPNYVPTV